MFVCLFVCWFAGLVGLVWFGLVWWGAPRGSMLAEEYSMEQQKTSSLQALQAVCGFFGRLEGRQGTYEVFKGWQGRVATRDGRVDRNRIVEQGDGRVEDNGYSIEQTKGETDRPKGEQAGLTLLTFLVQLTICVASFH